MKICIIGSGISGLQTLNELKDDYECHIFDGKSVPGGVWQNTYDRCSLQVPSELYEFVDMPSSSPNGSFPDSEYMKEYINNYTDKYKLKNKGIFHLGETVDTILKLPNDEWTIVTTKRSYQFDYCIICTGMYNDHYIPLEYEFDETIHTSEFNDATTVQDKNVMIIGGGKSAIDCAVTSSKYAKNVFIYSRKLHWPIPRYILGLIPVKYIFFSRLGNFLFPKYWNLTDSENKWHERFSTIKSITLKIFEKLIMYQFGLKEKPNVSLYEDISQNGQIINNDYYKLLNSGKIKHVDYDEISQYLKDSDTVICGTGFTKDYSIFHESIEDSLNVEEDGLWLYKNIIPPNVRNLAFIGSEVSTFNDILTQNLQAKWLRYHLDNEDLPNDNVPSIKLMMDFINEEKKWKRLWMPKSYKRAGCLHLNITKYHDILMKDMGKDIVKNKWWQWFLPITSLDYSWIF